MNTYTIYLGTSPVACVSETVFAYKVYSKTRELAELLGKEACLIWDETAEVVTSYDPEEDCEPDVD